MLRSATAGAFLEPSRGFSLVVGPKGSRLELVLNTVFHLGQSPGLLSYAVFEEIEQLGGAQMFLNLGAREFKEAKNRILARVRKELKALRHELDDIMYRLVKDVEALHTLRRDCDGIGNKSCQAAYNRKVKSNP